MTHKAIFSDFLDSTAMHGLKFIGDNRRHAIERVLWILMFCVGVSFSAYMCWAVWKKWDEAPVLMAIETTNYPLNDIYFPTVTVCNQNKVSKSKLHDLLQQPRYSNFSFANMTFVLRTMIKLTSAYNRTEDIKQVAQLLDTEGISIDELINVTLKAVVSCNDMFVECQWQTKPVPCSELFVLRPTDDGLCCTFNGQEANWSPNNNDYSGNKFLEPRKVQVPGIRMGLTAALDANLEDYAATTGRFNGFKVLIHNSRDFPEVTEKGFLVGPGFEVNAAVDPVVSLNTPAVDKLPLKKRKCLLETENPLKFYANYSTPSCYMEDLTEYLIQQCHCRPYYYAALSHHGTCGMKDYGCLNEHFEIYRMQLLNVSSCNPMCNDVWFNVELSSAEFPGETFLSSRTASRIAARKPTVPKAKLKDYLRNNVAMLNVYFKSQSGILYRKDIRYGVEDFISAIGGLLGLGFGFSFISAFEIFYFTCVRWIFAGKTRSNNPKSDKDHNNTNQCENQVTNSSIMELTKC